MERKDWENFVDEVLTAVKDGLNKLAQKTDQLTQIGRLRLDIISIKRDIEKEFTDLGGEVYRLATKGTADVLDNETVKATIERIKKLEVRLEEKKAELEKLSKAEEQRSAASQEAATASSGAADEPGTS